MYMNIAILEKLVGLCIKLLYIARQVMLALVCL